MDVLEIRRMVQDVVAALAAARPYDTGVVTSVRETVTNANGAFNIAPGTYRVRLMVGEIAGVQTNCAIRFGSDAFSAFPKTGGYASGGVLIITGKERALVRVAHNVDRQPQPYNTITDGPADVLGWVRIL